MVKRKTADRRKFCGIVRSSTGFSYCFAATVADASNGAAKQFLRDMRAQGRKRLRPGKIMLPVTVFETNDRDWSLMMDGRLLAEGTEEEIPVAAQVEVEV